MKGLYILMLLIGMPFSGCTNVNGGTTEDSCLNASENLKADSCGNKMEQESLENVQKIEKDCEKQPPFVIYQYLFYLSAFINLCFIILVYKKNIRLNELEEKKENDRWRGYSKSECCKEQKIANLNRNDAPKKACISKESDNLMNQEPPVLIEEKPVVIDFPLEKKNGKEYKYLTPSYQGKFTKLFDEPSGKTRFRCWMEKDGWHFEFHGDLKTAIENYNATFDETCIVEGSYNGATQYKIEQSGTLDKDLRILTKSTIQLY